MGQNDGIAWDVSIVSHLRESHRPGAISLILYRVSLHRKGPKCPRQCQSHITLPVVTCIWRLLAKQGSRERRCGGRDNAALWTRARMPPSHSGLRKQPLDALIARIWKPRIEGDHTTCTSVSLENVRPQHQKVARRMRRSPRVH